MLRSKMSQFGTTFILTCFAFLPASAIPKKAGKIVKPLFFQVPTCDTSPDFLQDAKRTEIIGGLESLPKGVLIARDAEMWVEAKSKVTSAKVQMHTYQSFVNKKSRTQAQVVCATSPQDFASRFSIAAPTLIDTSKEKKTGHSMWLFQAIADNQAYSVWNKKSTTTDKQQKFDLNANHQGEKYKLYQVSQSEYEIIAQKDEGDSIQTLSVRYEMIK
jgi:hypothetical protein